MSQCICRIDHGRLNVFRCQAGVGIQQIALGGPFTQLAQYQLYGDSSSRITGLPSITLGLASIRAVIVILRSLSHRPPICAAVWDGTPSPMETEPMGTLPTGSRQWWVFVHSLLL